LSGREPPKCFTNPITQILDDSFCLAHQGWHLEVSMTPLRKQDHLYPVFFRLSGKLVSLLLHHNQPSTFCWFRLFISSRAHAKAFTKPSALSCDSQIEFNFTRALRFSDAASKNDCVVYEWVFLTA
jgi:hypothetical protein